MEAGGGDCVSTSTPYTQWVGARQSLSQSLRAVMMNVESCQRHKVRSTGDEQILQRGLGFVQR